MAETIYHGDCLEVMKTLAANSIDAVVTDPPYGIEFMGKTWDSFRTETFQSWCQAWATECLRVLKPGGYMLAFGGTRTWHRLGCAIEDAGFEIRDTITWHYASGFPKSLDVGKAIDKAAGAEREVVGDKLDRPGYHLHAHDSGTGAFGHGLSSTTVESRVSRALITAPATESARQWDGWGTALKPASEPIVVARKPFKGTVATNVTTHGTGGLNIDGCRVGNEGRMNPAGGMSSLQRVSRVVQGYRDTVTTSVGEASAVTGRWPTNVVFTHAPECETACVDGCPVAELDAQSGTTKSVRGFKGAGLPMGDAVYNEWRREIDTRGGHDDSGGASRFFPTFRYQAKAPTRERPKVDGVAHPTVKPLELMRWMVRLVTPPGGTVLDPFAGSGTTAQACVLERFNSISIERDESYIALINARLEGAA